MFIPLYSLTFPARIEITFVLLKKLKKKDNKNKNKNDRGYLRREVGQVYVAGHGYCGEQR